MLGTSAGENRWVRLFTALPRTSSLLLTGTENSTGRKAVQQLAGHCSFKKILACFPLSGCLACREGLKPGNTKCQNSVVSGWGCTQERGLMRCPWGSQRAEEERLGAGQES